MSSEQSNKIELLLNYVTEKRKETFYKILKYRTRYISVLLENIYQPHNASAVLRSCDAFGVQNVHVLEHHNVFEPNQAIAMGSAKWLSIEKTSRSVKEIYSELRATGYKIVATSLESEPRDLAEFDISKPSVIVFGNELKGLSPDAISLADEVLTIPMFGFVESFNISVSVAIVLSNLIPRLHNSEYNWKLSDEEAKEILLDWLRSDIHKADEIEEKSTIIN